MNLNIIIDFIFDYPSLKCPKIKLLPSLSFLHIGNRRCITLTNDRILTLSSQLLQK